MFMPYIAPGDLLLNELAGVNIYILMGEPDLRTPEEIAVVRADALFLLQDILGQDFGYDVEAWHTYLEEHPDAFHEGLKNLEIGKATQEQIEGFFARHPTYDRTSHPLGMRKGK